MKKRKAVVIASVISGISLVLSEVSVYATDKISDMAEVQESEFHSENESENENENKPTEIEESSTQQESESEIEKSTQQENESTNGMTETDEGESETEMEDERLSETVSEENESQSDEELTDIADESGQIEKRWRMGTKLTSLQMPQRFDIIIDPWEMDGRTQVYSEEYIIRNTGAVTGTLKLTGIACEANENITVQENSEGIHDGKDKKIHIELIINGEDRIVLLPEGSNYEIELEADEHVTLEFTGEINENSSEEWQSNDVRISVVYDWTVTAEEDATEEMGSDMTEESPDSETDTEEVSLPEESGTEEEQSIEEKSSEEAAMEENPSETESETEEKDSSVQESSGTENDTDGESSQEEKEQETNAMSGEDSDNESTLESDSFEEMSTTDNQTEIQQEIPELGEETENEQEN